MTRVPRARATRRRSTRRAAADDEDVTVERTWLSRVAWISGFGLWALGGRRPEPLR